MKNNMIRTAIAGAVLVCGVAVILLTQPSQRTVSADYLVRPTVATTTALSDATLSDWEYTLRTRTPKCRNAR